MTCRSLGLEKMFGVQEQRRRFEKWRGKFSQTVSRQLNNLFIHLVRFTRLGYRRFS